MRFCTHDKCTQVNIEQSENLDIKSSGWPNQIPVLQSKQDEEDFAYSNNYFIFSNS